MNVVNVVDSPITRALAELSINNNSKSPIVKDRANSVMLKRASSALSAQTIVEAEENDELIGMYMKSGFCYSDVKCFIPMVISMALIAIWFSDKTSNYLDKESLEKRKELIKSIEDLPKRIHYNLGENDLKIYKKIAAMLQNQTDIFILAKGTGFFAANYTAQKFL